MQEQQRAKVFIHDRAKQCNGRDDPVRWEFDCIFQNMWGKKLQKININIDSRSCAIHLNCVTEVHS